jgi:hypothetical protein
MESDSDRLDVGGDILPFPGVPGGPAPARRWSCVFDLDGVPVQFVGELFEDAAAHELPWTTRGR